MVGTTCQDNHCIKKKRKNVKFMVNAHLNKKRKENNNLFFFKIHKFAKNIILKVFALFHINFEHLRFVLL